MGRWGCGGGDGREGALRGGGMVRGGGEPGWGLGYVFSLWGEGAMAWSRGFVRLSLLGLGASVLVRDTPLFRRVLSGVMSFYSFALYEGWEDIWSVCCTGKGTWLPT